MSYSILRITDGTNTVDFLDTRRGFLLHDWQPSISPFKGGGVWQSSPLSDGRRMVMRNFDNSIETFNLKCTAGSMDTVIEYVQGLMELLEKALAYWTTDWQKEPVWIEVRGAKESNTRYALIKNYTVEGLSSPFSQPFFAFCRALFTTDLTVILERDHWLDLAPGNSICVEANTLQEFDNAAQRVTRNISVAAGGDDMYIDQGAQAGFSGTTRLYVGVFPNDDIPAEVGLRFQNVTVPNGAIIKRAHLKVVASGSGSDDSYDLDFVIMGENVDDAAVWTDADINGIEGSNLYTNYMARKNLHHTYAVAVFTSHADSWAADGVSTYINGLEAVIQEIVNRPGWVSGNSLALFIDYRLPEDFGVGPDDSRAFYAQDDAINTEPILVIEYVEGDSTIDGREDTCVGFPYIANKHVRAQITNVYRYYDTDANDTPDTYSGNLVGAATPFQLLQNNPHDNDEILFGIASSVNDCAPFDSLIFDLLQACADMTVTWYYATAAGPPVVWTELTVYGNQQLDIPDETVAFWAQPNNWVLATVNGVEAYWVKAVFTSIGGGVQIAYQQNRDIYTSIVPFLDVDSAQIPGELSAKARINLLGTDNINPLNCIVIGLRSKSRGKDFSAYLNFAPKQNPLDVNFFYDAASVTLNSDTTSPSNYNISRATSAIISYGAIAGFVFSSDAAIQYRGRYRAYLRHKQTGGAEGDVRIRLGIQTARNIEIYTEGKFTHTLSQVVLLDMGVIDFGTNYILTPDDYVEHSKIILYQETLTASSITMYYYDLILIPADEFIGVYNTVGTSWFERLILGNYLDIDSIGNPRAQRAIMRRYTDDYATGNMMIAEWEYQTRDGPIFQSNSNQRLWFLFSSGAVFNAIFHSKIIGKLYRVSRYLSMRGNS